jgi:uncharacterized protein (DUF58 family)
VILLIDASASQQFGTKDKFKSELTAELASVLAFSAIKNNDRVGMIIFTDRIEKVIRPKKGRNHILRLIREALYFKPQGKGTDITKALQYLNELWRRKSVVFLISDFAASNFEQALRITGKRHDLIALKIADTREKEIPDIGLLELEDAETGEQLCIDTTDTLYMKEYRQKKESQEEELKKLFLRANVDQISVLTGVPYIMPLIQFFRKREKRLAH